VERRSPEPVEARDVGDRWRAEPADRRDEELGRERLARDLEPPDAPVLVPLGPFELLAEADVRTDAEAVGHAAEVGLDLGLEREGARPVGVRRERERVEVRRDVALAARVGVVAPGAADLVAALEHHEVVHAGLLELDRHAEAGEAAADDRDAHVVWKFGARHPWVSYRRVRMANVDSITQRRLPREEREPQMLRAAMGVFGACGYHGASMDDIAAAAGVTKPMFYAYFGSKDELYAACIEHVARRLEAALREAGADEPDPERQMWERVLAFFEFVGEWRDQWRVLRGQPGPFADELARARGTMVELTLRQLDAGAEASLPRAELEPLAHALVGAGEALADWWVDHPDESAEAIATRQMNLLWLGLERLREGQLWAPR
jgi:AcrR family transcriptional regulator